MLLQCLLNWLTVWVLQICFSFVPFDLIDITCAVFFLKTLFTCQAKNHRDVGTQNIVNVCKKHDFLQKKLGTISCKSINDAHQKWDVTLEKEGHVCFWMFFTTFGNHLSNYIYAMTLAIYPCNFAAWSDHYFRDTTLCSEVGKKYQRKKGFSVSSFCSVIYNTCLSLKWDLKLRHSQIYFCSIIVTVNRI